jgi:hypothetical protein
LRKAQFSHKIGLADGEFHGARLLFWDDGIDMHYKNRIHRLVETVEVYLNYTKFKDFWPPPAVEIPCGL